MTSGASGTGRDWSSDYDIFDPVFVHDPYPIWSALRDGVSLARTERWGGSWMPTRYEDIQAMLPWLDQAYEATKKEMTEPPKPEATA